MNSRCFIHIIAMLTVPFLLLHAQNGDIPERPAAEFDAMTPPPDPFRRSEVPDGHRLIAHLSGPSEQAKPVRFTVEVTQNGILRRQTNDVYLTESFTDAQGRLIRSTTLFYGRPYLRYDYEYSPNGLLNRIIFSSADSTAPGGYLPETVTHRSYDANGHILRDSLLNVVIAPNHHSTRIDYVTDAGGNVTGKTSFQWKPELLRYDTLSRTITLRDTSGRPTQEATYYYSSTKWNPNNRTLYWYLGPALTGTLRQSYVTNTWVDKDSVRFEYGAGNELRKETSYGWISGEWLFKERKVYSVLPDRYIVALSPARYPHFLNSTTTFLWISRGVTGVAVELSSDSGATWPHVLASLADTSYGIYRLTGMPAVGSYCLLRFRDVSDTSVVGTTPGTFAMIDGMQELLHTTGTVRLTAHRNGTFGLEGGPGIYGNGFQWRGGPQTLYTAGLIATADSATLHGSIVSFGINELMPISPLTGFTAVPPFGQIGTISLSMPYNGTPNNRLSIQQRSCSQSGTNYIVFIERVTNTALSPVNGLHIGMFADWDIGNYEKNRGGVVPSLHLVYQYDSSGVDPNYYGLVALTGFSGGAVTSLSPTVVSNEGTWIMKTGLSVTPDTEDQRSFAGSGPFTIPPSGSVTAAFALVGAGTFDSLSAVAASLLAQWNSGQMDVRSSAAAPDRFEMTANFPNPFNPSTTVRYALPSDSRVTVTVYNVLGQRVALLADEVMGAGWHDAVWNASEASGVYFCRIDAQSLSSPGDRYTAVRKMMLVK